jgi:hypothetical protein
MPLKTFRVAANLPGEIEPLVQQRIKEERYPSLSAYIVGLVLFDIYAHRPHWLTASLMREPQWMRDEVIAELVRDFGTGKSPGWFEKRVPEIIEEMKARHEGRTDP